MERYNFKDIEKKWQTFWEKNNSFKTETVFDINIENSFCNKKKINIQHTIITLSIYPIPLKFLFTAK